MDAPTLAISSTDTLLRSRLKSISGDQRDYWSFRHNAERSYAQSCFQYPAMMVPEMLGVLIDCVLQAVPDTATLAEAFIGSGVAMNQAMLRGLNIIGRDINPLAVLLCRTKSGPFFRTALEHKIKTLKSAIVGDRSWRIEIDFPGRDKWFRKDVLVALSRIRRAIQSEPSLWARRFFWVALAETVRLTSNSRTTTFKLHTRPKDEIQDRQIDVEAVFIQALTTNWNQFLTQRTALEQEGFLERGRYTGEVIVELKSSTEGAGENANKAEILVTSPSYGDNHTTVPYGQHSYLPLQWIPLDDIDENLDGSCLDSTREIDHRSLGGSLARALDARDALCELSPSFTRTLEQLRTAPRDRVARVCAFWRDLNNCIGPILELLKPNAYMIWIVGNRRVGGEVIPMDKILFDLLTARGAHAVEDFRRKIPSKRMAVKNNISSTMRGESVLVLRKAKENDNSET